MEFNPAFELAADFVNNTSCPIFLTGKAGTGKTTFLKYIREHTKKKSIVVAPTGVAAINAGGVTMHSFFQLPFGPYVPVTRKASANVTDKFTLFKDIRMNADKRALIRDLELVIIDEVSMVRSDMLDAMDAILRHFRRKPNQIFGGVQLLFIGDLYQLPPVMPDGEWLILRDYYESPFFFHSKAIAQSSLVYIELKKIFRQNEQKFIDILNRIRNNEIEQEDLKTLNERYRVAPVPNKKYVTLTSHNYKADKINADELRKLTGQLYEYKGTIEGDFPEKTLPTDINLQLKEGAQVMFIRNDKKEERRYFNGKLATVVQINNQTIKVEMNDGGEILELEKEIWDNIRYSYNAAEQKIDEEKLGSFSQYPIRLAWAITIHKSQGLTFQHAIIDAGDSFAPGQVYVALSRCVSLEGLILYSRIDASSISTHDAVVAFGEKELQESELQQVLEQERHVFQNAMLLKNFDLSALDEAVDDHLRKVQTEKFIHLPSALEFAQGLSSKVSNLQQVSSKFVTQLEELLKANNAGMVTERCAKAIEYFGNALNDCLQLFQAESNTVKKSKKVKPYIKLLGALRFEFVKKIDELQAATYEGSALHQGEPIVSVEGEKKQFEKTKKKTERGESNRETLAMFRAGKSMAQIAEERGLSLGTIESHIATWIRMGEVSVYDVLPREKFEPIVAALKEKAGSLTIVKSSLGDDYSYGEIRAVVKHLEFLQSKKKSKVADNAPEDE